MLFPHHTIDRTPEDFRAATLSAEKQFGAVPEAVALLASPRLLEFTDTVTSQSALGREPKDFIDFGRETARADGWVAA